MMGKKTSGDWSRPPAALCELLIGPQRAFPKVFLASIQSPRSRINPGIVTSTFSTNTMAQASMGGRRFSRVDDKNAARDHIA